MVFWVYDCHIVGGCKRLGGILCFHLKHRNKSFIVTARKYTRI